MQKVKNAKSQKCKKSKIQTVKHAKVKRQKTKLNIEMPYSKGKIAKKLNAKKLNGKTSTHK